MSELMVHAVARPVDRMPQLPSAGITMGTPNESTASTMRPDVPPVTPEEIQKWRKSSIHAPGTISKHPGYVHDQDHLRVPVYGKKSDEGIGVHDLLQTAPKSHLIERAKGKKEAVYNSSKLEPLGQSMKRGHQLPTDLASGERAFGKATPHNYAGLATKTLLAPVEPPQNASESVRSLYKKSHSAFDPGEQKHRGYDWGTPKGRMDPAVYRFGKPGDATEHNAIYFALHPKEDPYVPAAPKVLSKALEDFKEMSTEELGKPKSLGHGDYTAAISDEGFGMPSKRKGDGDWNARECLEGDYSLEEQLPDVDLGQAIRPGWRNVTPPDDRAFGVPNVRSDIPRPLVKSVADFQNYGNEPNGGQVISPSHFAQLGIDEGDFLKPLTFEQIKSIFRAIDTPFGDDVLEEVYGVVRQENDGTVTIAAFRAALFSRL